MKRIKRIAIKKTNIHGLLWGELAFWELTDKRTTIRIVATPATNKEMYIYIETKGRKDYEEI